MTNLLLTNSLTRKKEIFKPIKDDEVGVYTCGPTVYSFATIGNFRTYCVADILVRVLAYNSYKVKYVMNITDVGHLTGDNLGDADTGEDRLEKAAAKEGKTAWDIAKYYTEVFIDDFEKLNLQKPLKIPKATKHIKEQIDLVERIEDRGMVYKTSDGIYFDTKVYEKKTGKRYGALSTMDKIIEGARVEVNPEKHNPRDFALWKFSENPGERQMEWDSPWGLGFPGWHIECSAMSMKYLGESFDIHVGGEDLRQTHHPNEIAQSEAATDKTFVKYWLHATFLQVDGKKMSKSLGNVYTVADIESKGYDPLALKYLFLTSHYRDSLNFTWTALDSAQKSLNKLYQLVRAAKSQGSRTVLSQDKRKKVDDFQLTFLKDINDDLNTPRALAKLWSALKSNIPSEDKYDMAVLFDQIFGLKLADAAAYSDVVPKEVIKLVLQREDLRKSNKYKDADAIRKKLTELGYEVKDTKEGSKVNKLDKI